MMKMKRALSALLAVCLLISVLPATSLAAVVDTTTLHNCNVPEGYHLFTDLPTADDPVTTEPLYWGASFDGVFHGMTGSGFSSGSIATSTDVAAQNKITIHYGGNDETYGDYYYLVYTLPSGTAYTFAYSSGYFSQNAIQNTGLPSGGWQAKHKLFYDANQHIFYHRPSADMTVQKALKISASSFKFFTDTVAKVLADGTYPVRVYTVCTSDNVAGENATHQWSGSCKYEGCETKFDYQEKQPEDVEIEVIDPAGYHKFDIAKLPKQGGESVSNLYLGAAFEADGTFYGMSSTASSNAYPTATALAEQCKITIHYGGVDETYGTYYYVEFTLPNGTSYALAYASGYFSQNKLTDGEPSGGWAAKHKMFFKEDYQFFYHRPSADMTVMKGLKISAESKKLFTDEVANLKLVSEAYSPVRLFEACTSDNVAGTDDVHVWTGTCQECAYKFDYQVKVTPDSYHVVTNLPTAENPEITGLSLGGNLKVDGKNTFYGLNAVSTVNEGSTTRYFTTATEAKEQCIITVRYAGTDNTFGDYYHVIFRIPGGDSYALTYAGGYFSQNKLTEGEPADGWATKHEMFYNAEGQFFYFVIEGDDEIVMKGLKLSTTSQQIFTEKVENLKTESDAYVPVRLYEPCVSDEVAGKGAAGRWSGVCTCGYKFDLTADPNLAQPEAHHEPITLPTAENPAPNERLHFGTGLVTDGTAVFYGMGSSFDSSTNSASTATEADGQYTFRILYGGNDPDYGDYYYVIFDNLGGTEYAFAYAGGHFSQNKILENGEPTDGWAYKHRLYFDADGQFFYHRPSADKTVMKGIGITEDFTLATKTNAILKGDNNIYPIRPYVICTSDNVAGETDTHHWSGVCSCGYKFDYEENYVVQLNAPEKNTPYFWGVTQLDAEGEPTYFFAGTKLTSNFNTQLDMLTSTPVYVDVVEGGYNLYFLNDEEVKQYICLGKDASNSYATYINIVEDGASATVFTWNTTYNTFVTSVVKNAEGDTVDMVLGAYTSGSTAYTKLNPLTLASLAQEHYFASQLYVKHMAHTYGAWTMDLDNSGKMYRVCECGHVQGRKVSAEMPAYKGVSISLNNSFAINFHVETEAFASEAYTNPYVVFEMLGQNTTVTEHSVKGGDYVFTFKNLAPDLMGETVKATLYATAADSSVFTLTSEYSVAKYCYTALGMERIGDELKGLLVETLNFGAASQTYRDREGTLVNANLTDEQRNPGELRTLNSCRDFGNGNGSKTVNWYGATLVMGDSIKLRVYFTAADATGLFVKAEGATVGEHTLTNIVSKDGRYYVDFAALNPAQFSEKITFTVYSGEDAVSTTMYYSVESYAEAWLNKENASEAQKGLVKAVIRYGDAAAVYAALQGHTVNKTVELATGVTKYDITYHVSGTSTQAYAVVVNKDAEAEVMAVAATWNESNNANNSVSLKNAYAYRSELIDAGKNVLAITNGGFFKKSEGSNLPWGMQIINGTVYQAPSKADLAYSDNWFGVTKDGAYVISDTDGYNNIYEGQIAYGIGGGKLLIKNGAAQTVSGEDSYRTCVGITDTGDLILMCLEKCSYDMAIFAFQELAGKLGVDITTVLNMDGGGSTTMYTNNVRWRWDFDISGEDGWTPRKVADAIAIVAK